MAARTEHGIELQELILRRERLLVRVTDGPLDRHFEHVACQDDVRAMLVGFLEYPLHEPGVAPRGADVPVGRDEDLQVARRGQRDLSGGDA